MTDSATLATDQTAKTPLSRVELVSMITATVAFSIDAMLPVLPDIGAALSPDTPTRAQLVVASFVLGMGGGTILAGPLSDAFGRRPVAAFGAAIYTLSALVAAFAQSLEVLLVARFVQGFGASGPRVVAMALVRDLFSGAQMARIMSFVMAVFTLVPVLAPSMGAALAWAFGWRAIFAAFAVFSFVSIVWLLVRQPETLAPTRRRPFRPAVLWSGIVEVFSNRRVVLAILVQTLMFAILFAGLLTSADIFDQTFDRKSSFPIWFGIIAAISASASLLNAAIVMRLGMERVVQGAIVMQAIVSSLALTIFAFDLLSEPFSFAAFVVWQTSLFFMMRLTIGNMNAVAMEPLGHMAGLAASIISSAATIVSILLAIPVGQAFDGTPTPVVFGVFVFALLAFALIRRLRSMRSLTPAV